MKRWLVISAALALGVLAPASAQQLTPVPSLPASTDYTIGAQDMLQIDVFDVADLSRAVQVDSSGFVVVPLIGEVLASGRTAGQLSQDIAAQLDKKYLKNPIVTVTVKDAVSQKVTVDGSVVQPGLYQIGPHTTLMQAVALAKGPDAVADPHHVALIRRGVEGQTISAFDLVDIRDGKAVDPLVRADDIIVVDASGSRRFVRDFGSVISLAGVFRP